MAVLLTAASRFYGLGDQAVVKEVMDALDKAGERLRKYLAYDVPKHCRWRLPKSLRVLYGDDLRDDHRMLELISRQMGKRVKGRGIIGLQEADLEMLRIEDLRSAAAKAIDDWIPRSWYLLGNAAFALRVSVQEPTLASAFL